MNQWEQTMRARTKRFALDVIKLVRRMPRDPVLDEPKRQLVKAACGTFGNYRSACRGRSHAEFAAKLGVALDEADESEGWLEIFDADGVATSVELRRVLQEASELRAIFFKSNQTAQANRANRRDRG